MAHLQSVTLVLPALPAALVLLEGQGVHPVLPVVFCQQYADDMSDRTSVARETQEYCADKDEIWEMVQVQQLGSGRYTKQMPSWSSQRYSQGPCKYQSGRAHKPMTAPRL